MRLPSVAPSQRSDVGIAQQDDRSRERSYNDERRSVQVDDHRLGASPQVFYTGLSWRYGPRQLSVTMAAAGIVVR